MEHHLRTMKARYSERERKEKYEPVTDKLKRKKFANSNSSYNTDDKF